MITARQLLENLQRANHAVQQRHQQVAGTLDEFSPSGNFKPPVPPMAKGNDPWGDDNRSKILQTVRQLIKAGNKVDWAVPGQMGHVVRVDDDAVIMKRWGKPYSKIHYALMMTADRDSKYQILMVKPGHYKVVSSDDEWNLDEQGVAEAKPQDPDTFGGMPPHEWQQKLQRLRDLAQAGPLQTVRDPRTGRTRNVPIVPKKP